MKALAALTREFRIAYYERARKELQQRDPGHRDLPDIVLLLHTLRAQRPPIVTRVRSRCAELPGMCARDPNCEDRRCPGLYQRDGGHVFRASVAFPIEPETRS